MPPLLDPPPPDSLQTLREQLQRWEASHHKPLTDEIISTGCQPWDQLLPRGGFVPGQLVEWLSSRAGSGAATLAWWVAVRAVSVATAHQHATPTIVVVDRDGDFYPPAAIAAGISPQQVMIVRPKNQADMMWVIDQALRCSAVTAVWSNLHKIDPRHFRRMQLAAEEGATLGLLIRPAAVQGQPSWSDLQLLVEPQPTASQLEPNPSHPTDRAHQAHPIEQRHWHLRVLRCRGGTAGQSLTLHMDTTTGQLSALPPTPQHHEKSALHLATQLARPASRRRSARA